ncbi:MAG: DUF2844 domain-containing protein [Burkholderiales bacterium]|nr:DUF2844 domain-containing protein [Burkholderiales bacterium]
MPRTPVRLLIISTLLTVNTLGHAALGQKPSTLETSPGTLSAAATARRLSASTPAATSLYTVQETQLASSTIVQEYATPAGQVFAVTWQGPVLPNLQVLLGNYFPALQQETHRAQQAGRQRAPVVLQTPGLVVSSTGRMGLFKGHAYAPDLVPAGVDIQTLLP